VIPLKDNIPTDSTPYVTIALIVINAVVYFLLQHPSSIFGSPDQGIVIDYGVVPYEITHPGQQCLQQGSQLVCGSGNAAGPPTVLTIFSSMFMHGSLLHLAGNMLFLWIFGNNVEDSVGHVKFAFFYLAGGVAAIALQTIIQPDAAVPTIGASGAVAAVLGAYILLHPRARVITVIFLIFFFTVIELPAMLVLGAWFLLQVFSGLQDFGNPNGGGGGVAYFAHIGGFVFGLALIRLLATKRRAAPPRFPVY
jgi:membrane associated rhomboid family serine protease